MVPSLPQDGLPQLPLPPPNKKSNQTKPNSILEKSILGQNQIFCHIKPCIFF